MKKLSRIMISVLVLVGAGCDEETTGAHADMGAKPDLTAPDQAAPDQAAPDLPAVDGPVNIWPDIWGPEFGKMDTNAPFGCRFDSDCFGQKCCPTPWGVKLCAPSCTGQGTP